MSLPIRVRGARTHNLRSVDVDLPRDRLIVLTGVSGSGKSSFAFDTVHAEGTRRWIEALAAQGAPRRVNLRRPAVDRIDGLPATLGLPQRDASPPRGSTVGSTIDASAPLRVLFARAGTQHCPSCGAAIVPRTHDAIVAALINLPEGTRLSLEAPTPVRRGDPREVLDEIARAGFSRVRVDGDVVRLEDVRTVRDPASLRVVVDRIVLGPGKRDRVSDAVRTTTRAGAGALVAEHDGGALALVERPLCVPCGRTFLPLEPEGLSTRGRGACPGCRGQGTVGDDTTCKDCDGTGLGDEARAVRYEGFDLPTWTRAPITALRTLLDSLPTRPVVAEVTAALRQRLDPVIQLGLGWLRLADRSDRLSTGELQRLRLVRLAATDLSGVLLVLDEPAAGMSPEEAGRVADLLKGLRDRGNTLLVVEHHPTIVAAADLELVFGPGAGPAGGALIEVRAPAPASNAPPAPRAQPAPRGAVTVTGLRVGCLSGLDVSLPIGLLSAITGPSGSGKSTLLGALQALAEGAVVPCAAATGFGALPRLADVGRSRRSQTSRTLPATFVGTWDVLRELLAATREARVRGLEPASLSLAKAGARCEACQGIGERRVDLEILPDLWVPCDVCGGRRFQEDALAVRYKGLNPHEILDLPAAEALSRLAGHPKLDASLRALVDVGLGYLPLGQPGHTWSGGELQRLRIAREITRAATRTAEGTLYALDDPTVGLHPTDVAALTELLRRLTDEGATVWVATGDPWLAAAADHRITLESPAREDTIIAPGPR